MNAPSLKNRESSNKHPLQPASILAGNNRHFLTLFAVEKPGFFIRIGVKCLLDKKTKYIVSDHIFF